MKAAAGHPQRPRRTATTCWTSRSISDYEYDHMLQRDLEDLEREHPEEITPDSPTQRVGGPMALTQFQEVEHPVPLESLQDVVLTAGRWRSS